MNVEIIFIKRKNQQKSSQTNILLQYFIRKVNYLLIPENNDELLIT